MIKDIIVESLALLLALGQFDNIDALKTQFNADADRPEIVRILNKGCASMMAAYKAETGRDLLKLGQFENSGKKHEDSIREMFSEMKRVEVESGQSLELIEGVDHNVAADVYLEACRGETRPLFIEPMRKAVEIYNTALSKVPPIEKLIEIKNTPLKQVSVMLDGKGQYFSELFRPENRRVSLPLEQVPLTLQQAYIAIEDRKFYQHQGVDFGGIIRAGIFHKAFGKFQGASTISQQVVKNVFLKDSTRSMDRKILEAVVTSLLERKQVMNKPIMTKPEILQMYLNAIYMGRDSYGVEMAARSYFGKPVAQLRLSQQAMLAGLTHGPNQYIGEDKKKEAVRRRNTVLNAMVEMTFITKAQAEEAKKDDLQFVPFTQTRERDGYYFIDQVRDASIIQAKIDLDTVAATTRTTIHPKLQKLVEGSLQEGLWSHENRLGRSKFTGPEGSIGPALAADPNATWQTALVARNKAYYDIQWDLAVVTQKSRGKVMVGIKDGREMPLDSKSAPLSLAVNDLIFVRVIDNFDKKGQYTDSIAQLRTKTTLQGAVVVLENRTGRILALSGGFSYAMNTVNRANLFAPGMRPGGSAVKPFVYLTALAQNYQPNTLLLDQFQCYSQKYKKNNNPWCPQNYKKKTSGYVTLRYALEQSLNIPTARWLDLLGTDGGGDINEVRERSLARIRTVFADVGLSKEPLDQFSLLLGSGGYRPIDLAVAYATVANHGWRPTPKIIDSIEKDGQILYQAEDTPLKQVTSVDSVAFFQLKKLLQGVVASGTAAAISDLSDAVAGKTGTTDSNKDTWFAGFTNDITVVVHVGYDKPERSPTLGGSATGASVSLPIFASIVKGSFDGTTDAEGKPVVDGQGNPVPLYAARTPIRDPEPDWIQLISVYGVNKKTGQPTANEKNLEYFRVIPESLSTGRPGFYNTRLQVLRQYGVERSAPAVTAELETQVDEPVEPPAEDLRRPRRSRPPVEEIAPRVSRRPRTAETSDAETPGRRRRQVDGPRRSMEEFMRREGLF